MNTEFEIDVGDLTINIAGDRRPLETKENTFWKANLGIKTRHDITIALTATHMITTSHMCTILHTCAHIHMDAHTHTYTHTG